MNKYPKCTAKEAFDFALKASDAYKKSQTILVRQLRDEHRFTFGQYKGRLIADVIRLDNNYVKWCLKQGLIKPKYMKE